MRRVRLLLFLVCLLCQVLPSRAQEMPVPATIQAAIFKKIISLDRTLAGKGSVAILVVHTGAAPSAVLDAFTSVGLSAVAVAEDQLAARIASADIVYLMPGVSGAPQLSKSKGVLSLTGVPALVEGGKAAIGIGLKDGKPEIIVHMAQLRAEGHDISADLLKLARVI